MGRWVGAGVVEWVRRLRDEAEGGWLLRSSSETEGEWGLPVEQEEMVE